MDTSGHQPMTDPEPRFRLLSLAAWQALRLANEIDDAKIQE
jgi:hypothetical protein